MRSSLAATTPTATLRILRRGICSARGQQAILRRLFDAVDAGQQGLGGEHQVAAHLAGPQRPATARADVLGAGMLARDQAQKRGKGTTAGKHPGGLQRHRQSGRVGRADMRDAHQQATVGIGLHRRGQSRAGALTFSACSAISARSVCASSRTTAGSAANSAVAITLRSRISGI